MDITKLSITELKALKSDCYEAIYINQQNIGALNAEIQKKIKETEAMQELPKPEGAV